MKILNYENLEPYGIVWYKKFEREIVYFSENIANVCIWAIENEKGLKGESTKI